MTTKEWLMRAWKIDMEIESLLSAKKETWERCISVTSHPKETSVSSTSDPHKFDAYVALEQKIDQRIDDLVSVKEEILSAINLVKDGTLRTLLIERYINFKTWERIAVDMSYSYSQIVKYKHPQALFAVQNAIECHIGNAV